DSSDQAPLSGEQLPRFFPAYPLPPSPSSCNNQLADTPPVSACGDPLRPPRSSPWRGGLSASPPPVCGGRRPWRFECLLGAKPPDPRPEGLRPPVPPSTLWRPPARARKNTGRRDCGLAVGGV